MAKCPPCPTPEACECDAYGAATEGFAFGHHHAPKPRKRRVPKHNVATVWCGTMPRIGSGYHMYRCWYCRWMKRAHWQAAREQSRAGLEAVKYGVLRRSDR